MEVLAPYVLAERPLFDKWVIWVNTPHESDVAYIQGLAGRFPDFVDLVYPATPLEKGKSRPQSGYFTTTKDPGTVYVKFDDDVCYVAPGAVKTLVDFRLDDRGPFFVSANTVNNPTCAYIHQKYGAQSFFIDGAYQRVSPDYGNKVWSDVRYAEYVHKTFIEDLLNGDVAKYGFDSWALSHYQRYAINCIAWLGDDFAGFGGVVPHFDEEDWMCTIKAKELGRPNSICGRALVAHFAYFNHRKPHCPGRGIDHRILRAYGLIGQGAPPDEVRRALVAKVIF